MIHFKRNWPHSGWKTTRRLRPSLSGQKPWQKGCRKQIWNSSFATRTSTPPTSCSAMTTKSTSWIGMKPCWLPKSVTCCSLSGSIFNDTSDGRWEQLFFEGYGETEVDPLALAYYRYDWCVEDIGEFAEDVFGRENLGEETKANSISGSRVCLHKEIVSKLRSRQKSRV